MRILITLIPNKNASYDAINKHHIQAFIYSLLKNSPFDVLHNLKGFKYFTYSDIMPVNNFEENKPKYMVLSSPSSAFIKYIMEKINETKKGKIKEINFEVSAKKIPSRYLSKWITASPIVLYKDNKKNQYFSFRRDSNIEFFLNRLKENALKKYNAYYNDDLDFEGPIFDRMKFGKSVAVKITKGRDEFIIIGSNWKVLEKFRVPRELRKFYRFLFDCGLGEKNSLGFGCVNELRII